MKIIWCEEDNLRLFNLKRTLLHLAGTKTRAGQTGRSRGLLMNIFAAIEFKRKQKSQQKSPNSLVSD